jgi:hypothetical protein
MSAGPYGSLLYRPCDSPFSIDIVQFLQKLQARDYPDQYTLYLGDGSTNDGWPTRDE